MPLPTPLSGEDQDEFMQRCMDNQTMVDEFPEQEQRYAVCRNQWEEEKDVNTTEVKRFVPRELKLDTQGEGTFEAVFATVNVVDKDGDLTEPGAFGQQKVIVSQYNHGSWGIGVDALPIGVGEIYERGEEAIVRGEFNTADEAGRRTYQSIKYLHEKGRTQEWSYALPEIDYEMRDIDGQRIRVLKRIKVPEVSPVLMGAGVGTRLLDIKSAAKTAIGSHSTATDDKTWDAGANEKRVRKDEARSYYAKIYAWYNSDGEIGNKSTYRFPHHFVSSDGDPGAASTRACSAGIAVLNGGRGGANIPDADRQGIYRHLAKHLKDADKEPPELRSMDAQLRHMKLLDHVEVVREDVHDVCERMSDLKEWRDAKGKSISKATLARAEGLVAELDAMAKELKRILETGQAPEEMTQEFLRFQKTIAERRESYGN